MQPLHDVNFSPTHHALVILLSFWWAAAFICYNTRRALPKRACVSLVVKTTDHWYLLATGLHDYGCIPTSGAYRGVYCYHAHTYFQQTPEGLSSAEDFKQAWKQHFAEANDIMFGSTQNYARGTHPLGNFKAVFTRHIYGETLMWLQQHRPADLAILVHPLTLNFVRLKPSCPTQD